MKSTKKYVFHFIFLPLDSNPNSKTGSGIYKVGEFGSGYGSNTLHLNISNGAGSGSNPKRDQVKITGSKSGKIRISPDPDSQLCGAGLLLS
jgi:hypothetical protein